MEEGRILLKVKASVVGVVVAVLDLVFSVTMVALGMSTRTYGDSAASAIAFAAAAMTFLSGVSLFFLTRKPRGR